MILILYKLIILPIEYLIENIFSFFYYYLQLELGISIFFVSFAVTMMCLPFYYRADKISKEENEKLSELKPYIDKIKKNFKGDEQFFMLQTLYRQHNYNPIMALRNSFSLFLQIPFFIAAYHFFSNLELLNGYSWGLIKDYSQPDMLLNIGLFKINALPLLMTLINLVSCELYLKSKSLKTRIQPYLLALVFLFLLYNSPSGLVLYWTYNNFFYLLKNKFMDDKKPFKFIAQLFTFIFIAISFFIYKQNGLEILKNNVCELFSIVSLGLFLLLIVMLKKRDFETISEKLSEKFIFKIFTLCSLGMILLQGVIIPLGILTSDLFMFVVELDNINNTINFALTNTLTFLGLYFFWGTISLVFTSKKLKSYFIVIFLSFFLFSLFNFSIFGKNLGTIETNLNFERTNISEILSGNISSQIINNIIFIIFICSIYWLIKRSYFKQIKYILIILLLSEVIVSGVNVSRLVNDVVYINNWEKNNNKLLTQLNHIKLSKTGKNVIIIFLDRFMGRLLPMILEEKPELKKVFSGFIFYPNTVSYAVNTVLGYPPCVGGYEYIPLVLDKDKRGFPEKWLEASLMLLTLFKNNGFFSTVVHPIGDSDPNMRFYNDGNFTNIYSSASINYVSVNHLKMIGKLDSKYQKVKLEDYNNLEEIQKKLYLYSFLNIVSQNLKSFIYDDGYYLLARRTEKFNDSIYYSKKNLISSYNQLLSLKSITKFDSPLNNTFTLINNDLPHCLGFFQYPNYELENNITNIGINKFQNGLSLMAYHTTIASFLLVGKYIDFLKESGVYDNSRIIIVSDHGNKHITFFNESELDKVINRTNPLLIVKDFNDRFDIKTDNSFMTNADVPYIVIKDLVADSRNPFTGKKITINDKQKGVDIYMNHGIWNASQFTTSRVILNKNPIFLHVKDNIFNDSNWTRLYYNFNE